MDTGRANHREAQNNVKQESTRTEAKELGAGKEKTTAVLKEDGGKKKPVYDVVCLFCAFINVN